MGPDHRAVVFLAVLLGVGAGAAGAGVPGFIQYQARLTDSAGTPLNGTQGLAFSVHNAETGGTLLASGAVTATAANGLVSAQVPAWTAVFSGPDAWLEVALNGETLGPRTRMVSVPYAFRAVSADSAASASDPARVAKAGDTMTGTLTLSPASGDAVVVTAGEIRFNYPLSHIHFGDGGTVSYFANTSTSGFDLYMDTNANGDDAFTIHDNVPLGGAGEVFTVRSNGNVGIGTTAPAERLHIASGGIRFPDGFTQTTAVRDVSVRVHNSADIPVGSGGEQVLTFDSERFDTADLHSTSSNTGYLRAPVSGKYFIFATVEFYLNSSGGLRQMSMHEVGGVAFAATNGLPTGSVQGNFLSLNTYYDLAAGQQVELRVYQNSGGTLSVRANGVVSPMFGMVKLP